MIMSDLQQIKQKIINEDKIEVILESIGCLSISSEQRGELITAQLPEKFDSDNKRSLQVRLKDSLPCAIRSLPDFKGDIFSLISYIYHDKRDSEIQDDLYNSKKYICNLLGWTEFLDGSASNVIVKDYTACLKELFSKKDKSTEVTPNDILLESVLDEFYIYNKPLPYAGWIDEGISYTTQLMYGVGFDIDTKRITIPIRNEYGDLIGVKGRHIEGEDPKYLYLYKCNVSQELFNLHYAKPYMLVEDEIIVFESEKSTMKLFDKGIYNSVAIGSSSISNHQAMRIKKLGLDKKIIIAFDNDKTIDDLRKVAKVFGDKDVFAIMDTDELLNKKMAPIDKGIEIFNKLKENHCYLIK